MDIGTFLILSACCVAGWNISKPVIGTFRAVTAKNVRTLNFK